MNSIDGSTHYAPWDLSGKTVAVAGGGSVAPGWSIGRASCVTYARLGAKVCVLDRDLSSAQETVRLITEEGGSAYAYQTDMAHEEEIAETFRILAVEHGPLDVLHHNVGIGKTVSWSSFFRHSDRGSSFKLSELQTPDASRSYWVTGIPAWSAA